MCSLKGDLRCPLMNGSCSLIVSLPLFLSDKACFMCDLCRTQPFPWGRRGKLQKRLEFKHSERFIVCSGWNKSHKNHTSYVRKSGAEVGGVGLGCWIKDSFKGLRIFALNWMQLTECARLCRGGGLAFTERLLCAGAMFMLNPVNPRSAPRRALLLPLFWRGVWGSEG